MSRIAPVLAPRRLNPMRRNNPVSHLQSHPPLAAMDQAGHFPHGEVLNGRIIQTEYTPAAIARRQSRYTQGSTHTL
jgi:hypothetical protein